MTPLAHIKSLDSLQKIFERAEFRTSSPMAQMLVHLCNRLNHKSDASLLDHLLKLADAQLLNARQLLKNSSSQKELLA